MTIRMDQAPGHHNRQQNSNSPEPTEPPPADQTDWMMVHMQRLAAIGMLAAGAAHELANLLSVVTAASDSMQHELDKKENAGGGAIAHYVDLIERNARRSAQIAALLQGYGTLALPQMAVTDMSAITRDMMLLLARQFEDEHQIKIAIIQPADARSIVCDHNLVVQLLANLLYHARAQVQTGGAISLQVVYVPTGESPSFSGLDMLPAADHDCFAVLIQGGQLPGTAPSTERLAESWLTTAAALDSLSLRVAQEIANLHQGEIWLQKEDGPESGARIVARLPLRPPSGEDVRYPLGI
jgi:signal transduction histidine kinase